jgi:hypothetical protein
MTTGDNLNHQSPTMQSDGTQSMLAEPMAPPFNQGIFSLPSSEAPLTPMSPSTAPTAQNPRLILPATYHNDERILKIINQAKTDELRKYLKHDLDVARLNLVHKHLWMTGLPQISRPLHGHVMIGRQIVITERADLHLVWHGNTIYLKPLPDYLLAYEIWADTITKDKGLFEDASGFLYSYMWLICHKSDWKIAHDLGLLFRHISPRYLYGELRLGRLDMVYRFCRKTTNLKILIRGYQYSYHQYSSFIERNFAWVLTAIIYVTIVLTAMQVGLATEDLRDNVPFNRVSYGFTIFSILAPIIILFVAAMIIFVLVLFNWQYTMKRRRAAYDKYPSIFMNDKLRELKH